ncbi:MAG: SH3 domain-containing protein [Desulfobulbaceae bacterium]|nr:SH3 domain-containing protein [Desulfobulbaceae bacterium]
MGIPRKIIKVAILLTASFSLSFGAASSLAADYVSVNKDGANVRSGPDVKKDLLWEVFKDFPLQVISRQKEWIQIKDFEGDQGWIYANLVSSKDKRVIVKANSVNMRSEPSKDGKSVATVKYGVVFTPLEKKGEWLKVKHEDGTIGWISKTLVWPPDIL